MSLKRVTSRLAPVVGKPRTANLQLNLKIGCPMKTKMTLLVFLGTLAELYVMMPLIMNAGDPIGPIVCAVFIWCGIFSMAAVVSMPNARVRGNVGGTKGRDYMTSFNYYNTQAIRQDLDQMARVAQDQQIKDMNK